MSFFGVSDPMVKIYKAVAPDGMVYIGSTKQVLSQRKSGHKRDLSPTSSFGRLLRSYDFKSVVWCILEECVDDDRYQREQFWIDFYRSKNKCSNISNAGIGAKGIKKSEEFKKWSSEQMKKRWIDRRDELLTQVNAHKTKEFQSMAGKLGAAVMHKKYHSTER